MHLPLNSVNRPLSIPPYLNSSDSYSDSRKHGYQGSSRNVRLGRVIPSGGGALAKSDDGIRCAVTGKECKVIRLFSLLACHDLEMVISSFEDYSHF